MCGTQDLMWARGILPFRDFVFISDYFRPNPCVRISGRRRGNAPPQAAGMIQV